LGEKARRQDAFGVVEPGPDQDGAGLRVGAVVGEIERAVFDLEAEVIGQGQLHGDFQALEVLRSGSPSLLGTLAGVVDHGPLGHAELAVDWIGGNDGGKHLVGGLDGISPRYKRLAAAAADRGIDMGALDVEGGLIDGGSHLYNVRGGDGLLVGDDVQFL